MARIILSVPLFLCLMMGEGWIKIHRKLIDWEWYDDKNTSRLFIHLLLKANHKDKKYRGKMLAAGTILTGRNLLADEVGLSVRQVRTSLNKLKTTSEITIKTSSKGTEIQIVKYKSYQVTTSKATSKRPANDQQTTTNKNVKKEKKIYRAFDHLSISVDENDKLRVKGFTQIQIDSILNDIENYKGNTKYKSLYLTAGKWLGNNKPKTRMHPAVQIVK